MPRATISLNCGSSSIKFALYEARDGAARLLHGKVDGIGTAPRFTACDAMGKRLAQREWQGAAPVYESLLGELFDWLFAQAREYDIAAIGHRVVHGGRDFDGPVLIDANVLDALDRLVPLAPLHQPHNLAGIRAVGTRHPELPQVACFDTAFHHGRPEVAMRFALPRAMHDKGIMRYGFHGLSYEYLARTLHATEPALARGRILAAHLGNGASLCAMRDGGSVDTTMGFTALDGLVMGTRCGTLDPGVVLHLQRQEGMSAQDVEEMLYHCSGLLGVSAISNDMRTLHASSDARAAEAIDLFVWRAVREAGALIATMGGIDGLVFTGGIGENDAGVRAAVCEKLGWLGVVLDAAANARHAREIDAPGSKVALRVIPTDEERMIALHVLETISIADHAP